MQRKKKTDLFPAEKALQDIPIFRICLGVTIVVLILLIVFGVISQQLCLVNVECASGYRDSFDLLLIIAPLLFAFLALIGLNHRSVQTSAQIKKTDKQIELTEYNNYFSNHFKYIEEFVNYINSYFKESELQFYNLRETYNFYFPGSFSGELRASKKPFENIEFAATEIGRILEIESEFEQVRDINGVLIKLQFEHKELFGNLSIKSDLASEYLPDVISAFSDMPLRDYIEEIDKVLYLNLLVAIFNDQPKELIESLKLSRSDFTIKMNSLIWSIPVDHCANKVVNGGDLLDRITFATKGEE